MKNHSLAVKKEKLPAYLSGEAKSQRRPVVIYSRSDRLMWNPEQIY